MFVGALLNGRTLEPQIVGCNSQETLQAVFGLGADDDVVSYMLDNKTEAAWRIVNSSSPITWPSYILDAIEFAYGS
jgi:putative ATP-dependent endonuclease of OLD family